MCTSALAIAASSAGADGRAIPPAPRSSALSRAGAPADVTARARSKKLFTTTLSRLFMIVKTMRRNGSRRLLGLVIPGR